MPLPPTLRPGSPDRETVKLLQQALNRLLVPSPGLAIRGNYLERTTQAVKDFQLVAGLEVDGITGPNTWAAIQRRGFALLAPGGGGNDPPPRPATGNAAAAAPWLPLARAEKVRTVTRNGQQVEIPNAELAGAANNNPRILEYIATYRYLDDIPAKGGGGRSMAEVDETAWCACFVGWCLRQAGKPIRGTSAAAASWLNWGVPLTEPRLGCVAVVRKTPSRSLRSTTTSGNHVAFYISGDVAVGRAGTLVLLGGNQGNKVSEVSMRGWTVRGYRWPA